MKTVNRTKEIVGARAMIESLRQNKVPFSFATGALPKPAIAKLQQCDIWYDEALLATSKTHESREGFVMDAIVRAKRYYNRNNFDRIISVGDGVWDMKTAHNLNLDFVGIGSKYASYFKNNGVKECYEDMNTFSRTLMSKT
ncbi:HAD family hydrolase [Aquimarina sp. W85]|uniref:HAD family hydrolase n=1 Tax=Aquimarina rhodophyticola TaxID=3342246 RepID=UPI0036712BEE